MRVLHLSYHENSGGAAIATNRIHKSLLKSKVDSIMLVKNKISNSEKVISSKKILDIFLDKFNLYFQRKLHKINSNYNKNKVSKSYNLLPTFKLKTIKKINPDIVNLHWIGNNFINFKEISLIKKPIVWTIHDMWPYCGSEHYSLDDRFIHGYKENKIINKNKFFSIDLDKITWLKKKKYLSKKINFVPTSTWQENNLKKSYLFKNSNSKKIYYPINGDEWNRKNKLDSRKTLDVPLDKKILLFVSEKVDNPIKGFNFLKKMFYEKENNDFYLLVLGEKNKERFKNIKVQFKFFEKIKNNINSLVEIYSASDLLLAPSKLESFGIVAQEAACCGLPTVAFTNTGFEDTVSHKESGYIAKNDDLNDFYNGINWCLNNENYSKISENAKAISRTKFDENKIASEYINFYNNLINNYIKL